MKMTIKFKRLSENWVARATRPCRSATRRPEGRDAPHENQRRPGPGTPGPFRPASRRTGQASGLCYPRRNSQTGSNPMNPPATKRHALRAGFAIEEIFNLTKIDRWFLVQIKEIVDFEEELAGAKN